MTIPIEIIALGLGTMFGLIASVQGWILLRIFSIEKKLAVVLANCPKCQAESDTDHLKLSRS